MCNYESDTSGLIHCLQGLIYFWLVRGSTPFWHLSETLKLVRLSPLPYSKGVPGTYSILGLTWQY